ncbi:hypothetical protein WM23_22340 [Burkholderia ubonensis]|nr:hypothetical protein WM23_22340 [Burkholderia ubonensis]
MALDRCSRFPDTIVDAINVWGGQHYYVPTAWGGRLERVDELAHLIRLMARRDLSVAIAHAKTILGAIGIWMAADARHAPVVAKKILRGESIALALTERAHGSDISASMVNAVETDGEYRLNGEKYLINNATRSSVVVVYARTDTELSSRNFSLFVVEKDRLPASEYGLLPKVSTHGMKGADISGIRFLSARIPHEAVIGRRGQGLELILLGFQVTRTLCAALSCGAGDTALRSAYAFAERRRVAGQPLLARPVIAQILADSTADLLIADIVALTGARAANIMPAQMSVISAIVKGAIPERVEAMIERLADVMGARGYVGGETEYGFFEKLLRDCRLVSVFDGSTVVNLQSLVLQLPGLARKRRAQLKDVVDHVRLDALFNPQAPCPPWDAAQFSLTSHGEDDITRSLGTAVEQLNARSDLAPECRTRLAQRVARLSDHLSNIDRLMLGATLRPGRIQPCQFALAKQYAQTFCAACCLQTFLCATEVLGTPFRSATWLEACLDRLFGEHVRDTDGMLEAIRYAIAEQTWISVFTLPVSQGATRETAL